MHGVTKMKRKNYAILIELECIHERLCRINGKRNQLDITSDKKHSMSVLKRECIKQLLDIEVGK